MITLCMDTSYKHLVISLIKDDKVIDSFCELCPKKQSEFLLVNIEKICKDNNVLPLDINQVVITSGPGSYTGVRIAMSVAKVMCSMAKIKLFTINTLDLYSKPNSAVLMDARGGRAYYAIYNDIQRTDLGVDTVENIKNLIGDLEVVGDGSLLGFEDVYPNLAYSFIEKKDLWNEVDNVHTLVPEYLKDTSSYMVKK